MIEMKVLLFCTTVSLISILSAEIRHFSHESVIPGRYLIKLKDGIESRSFVNKHSLRRNDGVLVPLKENVGFIYDTAVNGFSAQLDENQLQILNSMSEVEFIESDQIVTADEYITQTGSPWGLARTSTRNKLNFEDSIYYYTYDSRAGNGSTIYVIDTGVKIDHIDFGGRASYGFNAITDEPDDDLHSHGTHVAGTAAGTTYGIAKNALIVSVKVLAQNGSGSTSGVAAGVDWVTKNAKPKSVINMSLGSRAQDQPSLSEIAVQNAVKAGITVVVAAGNSNYSACNHSPAREKLAITVAASSINDTAATFTNYGECVDVFGPGVSILSDGITSINATSIKSGTSMASPHVAGLAAYLLSIYDLSTPAEIEYKIKCLSSKDAISGIHDDQMQNTANLLIFNDWNNTQSCQYNTANYLQHNTIKTLFLVIAFVLIAKEVF